MRITTISDREFALYTFDMIRQLERMAAQRRLLQLAELLARAEKEAKRIINSVTT